jgi:hypothetical protein
MVAEFADGFAEPIVWGASEGYTIAEIAAGLGIAEALVIAVIESRSPVRFPRPPAPAPFKAPVRRPQPVLLSVPARVDPMRRDPQYLAWARSRLGAGELQKDRSI